MRGGRGGGGEGRWNVCLVGGCTAIERLEPRILHTGPAVALEQLANVQNLGAVLDGLREAAELVAHQRPVCSQLLMVFTHVDAVAVQVQRLLQVPLLERGVALQLQLVRSSAPLAPVLRPLVAAGRLLQCAKEQRPEYTHVFLHRLELWCLRRGRRGQLLVLVVAVIEEVPLQKIGRQTMRGGKRVGTEAMEVTLP